ncbi:sugar ABC transporter substrate-binding protein [Rathayibacter sp. AY1G1]|jgi:multiple sugar transport system substrate-binding protein|uniref:ABC transporter substrate-binding protein n=1 Tax=unclassified Rathayibacter TaxID=2609250 RepID=UPI000CE8C468|nr:MULTISPECIES: sugar ABC transporter substrate-binding protein [unclassified Rathayibacter]PPI60315.1 sugar ABC transporter substrate-binding protein [Rathayibacter sp. TRS19]PPF15075.1 sugar ABC transporter substrate-binding protein [Rathayibacter sp. AY1A4]PPF26183.1 sugar ABC transporter substrate-binding protein [Rathayibacter sp. AY1F2]PPF29142.1 sugar ABC transporter substrate-binding protein [Rathayibacter sp. AY1A3]PPF36420.1 sugar ABC transporter substrate-binding protein [Rathayiba
MKIARSALRRTLTVAAVAALAAGSLAACSSTSGGGTTTSAGSAADLDSALEAGGKITYWSWTPSAEAQVAAFEKAYPKVDVELVNAGTNKDEYTKLENAIKAGSGAPDVVQIEYYAMPQFALSDSLLDLSQYGMGDLEDKYSASTWGSVNIDGKLVGLPQDSGPMALFYNKTVFDQYGIAVPATWDEYVAAAEKLHTADPSKYITADTGDAGFATSMIWQAGGEPFTTDGTDVKIDLADEGTAKWTGVWNQLVEKKLLSDTPAWGDEWYKGLADGSIASLVTGAWMPGVLESSVPDASGDWAVAPIPTYDGTAVSAENGGGGQSVTKQSENPALAAAFLRWLNSDQASVDVFLQSGGFPSTTADLDSSDFTGQESEYFGGQKINEVLTQASKDVRSGWSYLPYQVYANSVFGDTVGQAYANGTSLDQGLADWQSKLVQYGNAQGFTVSE